MSRLTALSIALSLVMGPGAVPLCISLCYAQAPVAIECWHTEVTAGPTVAVADRCDDVMLAVIAFVPEDARRGASAPWVDPAVQVSIHQFAHPTTGTSPGPDPGPHVPVAKRPAPRVLRI